jgi:hypothetical protein
MSPQLRDELFVIWSAARADANLAYDAWRASPGADSYVVYRAAEDRADARRERAAARRAPTRCLTRTGGKAEPAKTRGMFVRRERLSGDECKSAPPGIRNANSCEYTIR